MDKIKNYLFKRQENLFLFIIIALTIITISPMLFSGYYGDDSFNSLIKGTLIYEKTDLFQYIMMVIQGWASIGRLLPFAYFLYALFYFIDNLLIYKSLILVSVLINLILFYFFIKKVTASTTISQLSTLLLSMLFQFRLYNDPILSYNLLMQLLFFNLIAILLLLIFYIEKGKITYLLLSLVFLFVSLLTYEIIYTFFILIFYIAYIYLNKNNIKQSFQQTLKLSLPYISLTFLCFILTYILKIMLSIRLGVSPTDLSYMPNSPTHLSYIPNFSPTMYLITLGKQIVASFPLSYFTFDLSGHMNALLNFNILSRISPAYLIAIIVATIGFFFLALFFSTFINNLKRELVNVETSASVEQFLLIFGLLLIFLPNLIIPLSPKYQTELTWGIGYLPVYISYFGVSILIVLLIIKLLKRIDSWSTKRAFLIIFVIGIVLAAAYAVNFVCNAFVVLEQNKYWQYPRDVLEDGLHNGLMNNIPDNAILIINTYHLWDKPDFYVLHSSKMVDSIGANGIDLNLDNLPINALKNINGSNYTYSLSNFDPVYFLEYKSSSSHSGYAILAHVDHMVCTNKTISHLYLSNISIYVENSNSIVSMGGSTIVLTGNLVEPTNYSAVYPFSWNGTSMDVVSSGDKWKIYRIDDIDKLLDITELNIQY